MIPSLVPISCACTMSSMGYPRRDFSRLGFLTFFVFPTLSDGSTTSFDASDLQSMYSRSYFSNIKTGSSVDYSIRERSLPPVLHSIYNGSLGCQGGSLWDGQDCFDFHGNHLRYELRGENKYVEKTLVCGDDLVSFQVQYDEKNDACGFELWRKNGVFCDDVKQIGHDFGLFLSGKWDVYESSMDGNFSASYVNDFFVYDKKAIPVNEDTVDFRCILIDDEYILRFPSRVDFFLRPRGGHFWHVDFLWLKSEKSIISSSIGFDSTGFLVGDHYRMFSKRQESVF